MKPKQKSSLNLAAKEMFPYNILASAADKGLPEVEDPGTSRTSHADCAELTPRADGDTEIWDKDLSRGHRKMIFLLLF